MVGEPVRLEHLELEGKEEAVVMREATDEVVRRIQELSGQQYVDEYAADVKKRLRDHRAS